MNQKNLELSNYINAYPYNEEEKEVILFLNSAEGSSKVALKEKDYESIKRGDFADIDTKTLYEQGILVESREQEKKKMLGFMDEFNKNEYFKAIVVMNLDCNLDCLYCFENAIKKKLYMNKATADAVVDYFEKRLTPDKKFLEVSFYGGEPLKSLELIKYISERIKERLGNIEYSFNFVTNGTLLTPSVVEELLPLGFTGAKITLDGTAKTHNRYRPYKGGGGSFKKIISHMKETGSICNIAIGGNYNQETWREFPLLLDYMLEEGLTPDKISSVKFDPIMEVPGLKFHQEFNGCTTINEPWLYEPSIVLREEILKKNYKTPKIGPALCMIDVDDYVVINYNGDIYKCPSVIGIEEFVAGHIQRGMTDYSVTYQLDVWKNQKCQDCSYMGLCLGGCRFMTYLREQRMDKPDCWKEYFDNTLQALTLQDVKYGRSEA